MGRPRHLYLALAIGIAAASQSGNLVRLGDAHPLAITTWRLALASLLLAPLAGRELASLRELGRGERLLLVAAGAAMTLHFFLWIAAVQRTTVANAATFFSINPVFTAFAGYLVYRERLSRRLFVAIGLGLLGVAVIGGADLSLARRHLAGDLLAMASSVLFTVYFLAGKKLRRKLPTTAYVAVLYGVAAAFGAAGMLALDLPAFGYDRQTWLCFLLMALVPTMIGHSSMNMALRYIDAGRISAATLSEPLLAGLVAYFAWGEPVSWQVVTGYSVICVSVLVLISDRPPAEALPGPGPV